MYRPGVYCTDLGPLASSVVGARPVERPRVKILRWSEDAESVVNEDRCGAENEDRGGDVNENQGGDENEDRDGGWEHP